MSEYVTLLGAEQVQGAARTMGQAAEDMQRAAASFYETAFRLIQAMDEHASRIERAVAQEGE